MKRLFSLTAALSLVLFSAPIVRALTVRPNVAPVVSAPVPNYDEYRSTTRAIDLTPYFSDPDASAAVQVTTSLGTMNFTLDGATAPATVANFLNYVDSGRYFMVDPTNGQQASLFFHRSVADFVIQTGGFLGTVNSNGTGNVLATSVVTFPPVVNEPVISNVRGTIAMAKLGGDPNSATSQWFINLANNSSNLDLQNGGFTVFGRVAGTGMTIADAIAALPRVNAGSPFDSLPVRNYTSPNPIKVPNLASIPGLARISPLVYSVTSSNQSIATVSISGTNLLVNGLAAGSAQITVTATDLDGAAIAQSFTVNVIPAPARLRNISTRVKFADGNDVLIAGFIIRGGNAKFLASRAIGPSLVNFGIPNPINDPTLELHAGTPTIASNNNWMESPDNLLITDLGLAPTDARESALLATVPSDPSTNTNYTAVVQSADQSAGVGLIEVYDLDSGPGSTILNLSLRGQVGTADDVMIGGFIIAGDGTRRVVVRAIGPSLANFGISGALPDPMIELRDAQGTLVAANDDWESDPVAAEVIRQNGLEPRDQRESAVVATLPAGRFTAKVSGNGSQPTGVGLIEIYQID